MSDDGLEQWQIRHWTEQWRQDQVGRRPLPNRTEFFNFFSDSDNDNSSFCSLILL